jgi:ribose/xylose/arabinose/galactoside ABC-type transport system permease subunit
MLVVMLVLFALFVPYFATAANLNDVALEASALLLLAGGGSVVLITGNFDLSSEGTMVFAAVFGAWFMQKGSPGGLGLSPFLVIPLMICFGGVIGVINGVLVAYFRVNAFVVTLAMLLTLEGLAVLPDNATTFFNFPSAYTWPGSQVVGGIAGIVFIAVGVFVLLGLYMHYSPYGRHVYAVGGNEDAALRNGINTRRVIIVAYVISGALAGLAGWLESVRVGSAQEALDSGIIFTVFAAMVIGGVSLSGGKGGLLGCAGGVLLMTCVNNVLNLANVNPLWVNAAGGLVIFVAIGLMIVRQTISRRLGLQERAW